MSPTKNYFNTVFLVFCFLLLLYLLLRAVYVLPVFDEITTFNIYIQSANFLPTTAYLDANNHLLFSALSTFFYLIFGNVLFFLRLPSILSFLLFAVYIYKFSKKLENQHAKYLLLSTLLSIPFVLEFFALARGYGLMLAFFLGLIYHSLIYLEQKELKQLWFIALLQTLTLASNLSAFNGVLAWLTMVFGFGLYFSHYKKWPFWLAVFVNILSIGAFAYYSFLLKNSGKLYHGGSNFIAFSLAPLHRYLHLHENAFYALIAVSVLFISTLLLRNYFPNFRKSKNTFANYLIIAFCLMLLAVFSQHIFLKLNYPEDRAALYLLISFLLTLVFISDWISPKIAWGIFALSLFYPVSLLSSLNLSHSMLWKQEHLPDNLYKYISEEKTKNQKVSISGHFDSYTLWDYKNLKNQKVNGIIQTEQGNLNYADFILARKDYYSTNDYYFDTVLFDKISGYTLLKQPKQLDWQFVLRHNYQTSNSSQLYQNLVDTLIHSSNPVRIFIEGEIRTEQPNFEGVLFCNLIDLEGITHVQEKFTFSHQSNHFDESFSFSYATILEKLTDKKEKRLLIFLMNTKNQSILDFQTSIEIDTLENAVIPSQNS